MAWPEKLPSGRWRGVYRDPVGKRHAVTDGGRGFSRKTDARDAASEEEVKARRRAAGARTSAGIKWGQWWDRITVDRDGPSNTATKERQYVGKHIRPYWGDVPLNQIEAADVRRWVREMRRYRTVRGTTLAATTVRRIYGVFSMSINTAIRDGVLNVSPLVGVELPDVPQLPKPYTTHDGLAPYLTELRADYARAVEFLLETGLRPSELGGLHAASVSDGWVIVSHVLVTSRKVVRPWPKNKRSRKVPLTSRAVEILAAVMDGRDLTVGCGVEHSDGVTCRSELVFRTERGRPMWSDNLRQRIAYAAEAHELEYRSPYAARRGFITWAAPGMDEFALQKIAGHSSKDQTAGYHQLTPAELARLRAARGEESPLRTVGQPKDQVADQVADRERTPLDTVGDETGESAG